MGGRTPSILLASQTLNQLGGSAELLAAQINLKRAINYQRYFQVSNTTYFIVPGNLDSISNFTIKQKLQKCLTRTMLW